MVEDRRLVHAYLQFFFVTLSLAQYFPQQQYYYPEQQQFYYPQQQQQSIQWPQQNIVYQQQQQTFPQVPQQQFSQQIPQQLPQQQYQQQQQQQQPSQTALIQQQPQSVVSPQPYKEQPQPNPQRIQEPKITKPDEAFDLPQPPSRFLPEGSKIIRSRVNQNSRRGGSISNQRRPFSPPRRQPQPPLPQPQRRVDVVHTRAPPTQIIATTPRPPSATGPPPPSSNSAGVTRSPSLPASQLSSSRNPNKFFLDCCQKKKVAKTCESRCNFDKLSKKVLTGMFLGTDVCPQKFGLDLFSCAAQDGDHRDCCRAKNVGRTGAGDKCLNFCLMTPDSNFQADASYLPCWSVLNDIKSCFREAIVNGHTL